MLYPVLIHIMMETEIYKKALRDRRIPFEVTAPLGPFYSNSSMEQLRKANWQIKNELVIIKTME